jgi:PTS system mannose-specific IID component
MTAVRRELDARTLGRCFLRSYWVGAAFNTRGMQNIGLAYALDPALQALYADPNHLAKARRRALKHYNTHPFWTPWLVGVFCNLEREIAAGRIPQDMMENIKTTTAYTLSAIGDSFFSGGLLPLFSLTVGCLWVSGHGGQALGLGLGLLAGLQLFKLGGFLLGFREGLKIVGRLKGWRLVDWSQRIKLANAVLLAAFWVLAWPDEARADMWGPAVAAVAAGALVVGRLGVGRTIVVFLVLAGYMALPWVRAWLG